MEKYTKHLINLLQFEKLGGIKMNKWILECSTDGITVDFSLEIYSKNEPDFWTCYDLAATNFCQFFTISKIS